MRVFAGDHFPRLAVQHGDLPRPWVMPSWAPRAHRDRLAALLAQALRALEPGLTLIELRWADRHSLLSGRLVLPSAALVWWRINAVPVLDPAAVVLDGSRLTPGLPVYDFDADVALPTEAWLGPLKMAVLHRLQDRLYDDRPVAAYEEIADAIGDFAALVVSPIDLITAAEAMVGVVAEGGRLETARAEAVAQVIATRFAGGMADGPVKALVAVGRKQALDDEGREVLRRAGLADGGGATTLVEKVGEEAEALRRTVLRVVEQLPLAGSLAELAPGVLPEAEASPARAPFDLVLPGLVGETEGATIALSEPHDATVREAWGLAEQDDVEGAARVVLRGHQEREDEGWSKEDLRIAGSILSRAAQQQDAQLGERLDPARLTPIATLLELAGNLFEQGASFQEAIRAWQNASSRRVMLEELSNAEALAERGRKLAVEADHRLEQAQCLQTLAKFKVATRPKEAIVDAQQAAAIFRDLSRPGFESLAMITAGTAHAVLGDLLRARETYEAALAVAERLPHSNTKILALHSMGRLAQAQGDFRAARKAFEDGLVIARDRKIRRVEALLHEALGELSVLRKESLRAREAFEDSAALYHDLGDLRAEATALEQLGDARIALNDAALAREAYDAALALARDAGDRAREAALLTKRSHARALSGEPEGSRRDVEDALHLYEALGDTEAVKISMERLHLLDGPPAG